MCNCLFRIFHEFGQLIAQWHALWNDLFRSRTRSNIIFFSLTKYLWRRLCMIHTNILEKHGRTEYERLLLLSLTSPVLNTGITFSIFIVLKNPFPKKNQKLSLKISLNSSKQFLIILKDIWSAPVLLLIFWEKKSVLWLVYGNMSFR